jgi:hypothetical protein
MRPRLILLPLLACAAFGAAFQFGRFVGHGDSQPVAHPPKRDLPMQPKSLPSKAATSPPRPDASSPPALPEDTAAGSDIDAIASYEFLMYAQPHLVDDQIRQLRAQTPGKVDLYAVGFAGDAEEEVFRNEVEFLPKLLSTRFGADGRTLQLINSPRTFDRTPLATRTNLDHALAGIGDAMDRDQDILLLFLTSHGSRDHQMLVEMGSMPLDQLTPRDIREALDRARIKWRVIVVSACYSGGFIPELREPHTMIITAARGDRTSFGCGSDSRITWFGKAFLTEALNRTTDFHQAYLEAAQSIAQWEKRDDYTPSEPQFWEGPLIEGQLAAWRATLPANAPEVAFAPAVMGSRAHRVAR